MSSEQLKVGVVGLGYWGPNRLRALMDLPGASVERICDVDPDRLAHSARRHPGAAASTELSEVLSDPQIDAVIIATPVTTHFELASASIEAGKHVFVEKPLAPTSRQAEELVRRAAASERVLMCGHTFLYSPPVRAIKEVIDRGELGDLYFISSNRVNLGPYRSDVSVVSDLGPHDFSILLYWLGAMPERVSAVGRDVIARGVPDVAFIDMMFPGGLLSHIELSWLAPSKLRRTVIVGSRKMLVYEDGSPEPVRIFDSGIEYKDPETFGEYHLSYRTGDIISPRIATTEPIVGELEDFCAAISNGSMPMTHPELAVDVIKIVEAVESSLHDSGQMVDI